MPSETSTVTGEWTEQKERLLLELIREKEEWTMSEKLRIVVDKMSYLGLPAALLREEMKEHAGEIIAALEWYARVDM
jgi:hypothetical protein